MQQGNAAHLVAGRYRLDDHPLASGGFGRIWKARDESLHVDVAVKEVLLSRDGTAQERGDRVARATREAQHAAQLRHHPHIVSVHDVVVDGGVPWIVMELVAGRSLEKELELRGRLEVAEVARIAHALLSALGAAHALGIVHRDIKPANVLLADDGRILLTDFGIAVHDLDTRLTGTGMVIGSFEYIAPERADGGDGAPPSDLFSLGVTLYQAVEGFSPFRRPSASASLRAVMAHHPAPPQHAAALTDLITQLLAKDPDERPAIPAALALLGTTPRTEHDYGAGPHLPTTAPPPAAAPSLRGFHAAWTGKEPLAQYARLSRYWARSRLRGGLLSGAGIAAVGWCGAYLIYSGIIKVHTSPPPDPAELGWELTAVSPFLSLVPWLLSKKACRHMQRRMPAWSLDIDAHRITAASGQTVYDLPWTWIESVHVGPIGSTNKERPPRTLEGLHVVPKPGVRLPVGDPAGWPGKDTAKAKASRDGGIPICVLGPLSEEQQQQWNDVVAHYTGALAPRT